MARGRRTLTIPAGPGAPDWWTPRPFDQLEAERFSEETGIDEAVAIRLLRTARPTFDDHAGFLAAPISAVRSPEADLPGVTAAATDVLISLKAGERIAIFCDYDPDGITGGEALRLGIAPYVRSEDQLLFGYADAATGFGLDRTFIRKAERFGAKTLITVDCGSGQGDAVALAQGAGMRVIVLDHHDLDPENPADHHISPRLHPEGASTRTGAQVAWTLGAAVQQVAEGQTRPELWGRAMYLAGLGALADRGPVTAMENRAFFWAPHDRFAEGLVDDPVPPGLQMLADALGEDPRRPGGLIRTLACLNLAKRTPRADAAMAARILAARDGRQAGPSVRALLALYAEASPARERMVARAQDQLDGEQGPIGIVVIDDEPDWAGYSGAIAQAAARSNGMAVCVACRRHDGNYKFSMRAPGNGWALGKLIDKAQVRAAAMLPGDDGEPVTSLGGHAEVVSGACAPERLDQLREALRATVTRPSTRTGGPRRFEAYPGATDVDGARLARIASQAARLAPFSYEERHLPPQASVRGEVTGITPIEGQRARRGRLVTSDGHAFEVLLPDSLGEIPAGEWEFAVEADGRATLRVVSHRPAPALRRAA